MCFLTCTCPRLRFRPTQTKSKKDSKLDLFGFDDVDTHQEDNSGDSTDGGSNYKIKYFGFDDMSDSDGADNEDGSSKESRRAKKAAAMEVPVITVEETLDVDPPDPFERLEIRERPAAKENKKNSERQENRIRAGKNTHVHTHARARANTHTSSSLCITG